MKKTRIKVNVAALQLNEGQLAWLPKNPRQWTQTDIDRTVESIRQDPDFLEDRPLDVVPAPQKGEFVVFCGNLRTTALGIIGTAETDAYLYEPERATLEEDRETIRRRAIKDNGQYGSWDSDELVNWGYEAAELAGFGVPGFVYGDAPGGGEGGDEPGGGDNHQAQEDDFDENSDEIHVRCKKGDIWELGEHRLMCGDSIDLQQVKALMGGVRADIAITSPPYGVNDGGLRAHKEAGNNEMKPKNFYRLYQDGQDGWGVLMNESLAAMSEVSDQQFINVQLLADNKRVLVAWAAAHADRLVDVLIWDKGHAAPQMQPNIVNNNYEFVFVFGDVGSSRKLAHADFKGNTDAVIRVPIGHNEFAGVHNAVFPVAFPSEILKINSRAQSVLDVFGGTGTTLIAAEQLGRKCYMMELDPHYCDVIIARWEKLTGKTAVKVN